MRILLAVDGSDCSLSAAAEAGRMEWPAGSIVRITTAVDVPVAGGRSSMGYPSGHFESWDQLFEQQGIAHVAKALARFNEFNRGRTEVTSTVIKATAKKGILDEAESWGADLIVLGNHGYRGLERFWLGSVSLGVATHARCSVRVVRPGRLSLHPNDDVAPRILLATDGSPFSEQAVDAIAGRTWPTATEVRVISAIQLPSTPVLLEGSIAPTFYEQLEQMGTERAESAIHSALSRLRESNAERVKPLDFSFEVANGHPSEAIIAVAERWAADLVVVGSQGWGGLRRFVLGSVSHTVVSHAPCSVEIVRS